MSISIKKSVLIIALSIFFSCSKEQKDTLCLKIKVIGYNHCYPSMMGAQIIEGPHIGQGFGSYDNVISIYGISQNGPAIDSILYVKVRDKKNSDNVGSVCVAIYPDISFSNVGKVPLSFSTISCNR